MTAITHNEADIIQQLRTLVPRRSLTFVEAVALAELQAGMLVHLAGVTEPPVPDEIITELPRIHVELVAKMHSGASGATKWVAGRWFILLNAKHPRTRRRFSLAHGDQARARQPDDQGAVPERGRDQQ